jgi:uncharacterized protein
MGRKWPKALNIGRIEMQDFSVVGMWRALACGVALIVFLTSSVPSTAQSFNCRYARAADEVMICQSRQLSALDERMSSTYYSVRNSLSGADRRRLERTNRIWLQERQGCGRDAACITNIYRSWIRDLNRF